ncbi:H3 lysine-79 specific, partial [Durusdinium trenchii]
RAPRVRGSGGGSAGGEMRRTRSTRAAAQRASEKIAAAHGGAKRTTEAKGAKARGGNKGAKGKAAAPPRRVGRTKVVSSPMKKSAAAKEDRFHSPERTRKVSEDAMFRSPDRAQAGARKKTPVLFTSPITPGRKKSSLRESLSVGPSNLRKQSRLDDMFASESKKSTAKKTQHLKTDQDSLLSPAGSGIKNQKGKTLGGGIAALEQKINLKAMYGLIRKKSGTLGGGGAGGAIYGEVTQESFQRVVQALVDKCGFGSESVFLDIGAGLGKPNFHVTINPGVKASLGVELIGGRWWQSMCLLDSCLEDRQLRGFAQKVFLAHANVTDMHSFDPITHVYSFNRGFPPEAMRAVAQAFHKSETADYFICFDKEKTILDYGFEVELVDFVQTKMAGSGEQHRCYIYRRTDRDVGPRRANPASPSFREMAGVGRLARLAGAGTSSTSSSPAIPLDLSLGEEEEKRSNETNEGAPRRRLAPEDEEEESKGDSVDWHLVDPPQEVEYAPHVPHAKSYAQGLSAMKAGHHEIYQAWVQDQIGLHRSDRSTRARRACRAE